MMIDMTSVPNERESRLAAIRRTLDVFNGDNECVQICATRSNQGGMAVGYFRDRQKAAEAAIVQDASKAKAIYTTLNPFNPALYARQPDAIHPAASAVKDADIIERHWLLVDIDPARPSGISANQAELNAASMLAADIEDALRAKGFPLPIIGCTGNGYAMLYSVRLPNTDETKQLVKDFLLGVDSLTPQMIDPDKAHAKVDTSVVSANQLLRLFGTTNRKGGETTDIFGFGDRQHRVAELGELPDEIVVVKKECIELVAAMGQEAVAKQQQKSSRNGHASGAAVASGLRLRVGEYLSDRGRQFRIKQIASGTAYILTECPFNAEHGRNGDVAVFQDTSGRLGFECKHDSCRQYGWRDFRLAVGPPERHHWDGLSVRAKAPEKLEPGTRVKALDRDNLGTIVADHGTTAVVHFVSPDGQEASPTLPKSQLVDANGNRLSSGPPQTIEVIDSRTLAKSNLRPRFIIDRILVSDQLMICGGPAKSLKTSILIDAAVSIGAGMKFLGQFQAHPHTVAVLSGESGPFAIQQTALRVARARGVDLAALEAMIQWGFQLPKISEAAGLDGLAELILGQQVPTEVVIVDPAYLSLLGVNMADMFQVGPVLSALAELGQAVGTTFIVAHHYRKNSAIERFEVPELAELSMAGFAEFARQWLLLGRRAAYGGDGRHQLWASVGGSVGHSGVYALDIDEGTMGVDFGGRKWDVAVGTVDDIRTAGKQASEQRAEDRRKTTEAGNREKLVKAIVRYPKGATTTTLKTEAGLNSKDFGAAISTLIDEGMAVACQITKANGQTYDAYKPSDEDQTNA